ncbi:MULTISPECIES: zf-HC2 domain-containing protein [unclassified Streptomyces]|uniref:zf-HC2 domain-containing protein n=1 Tax=unclassified Streptomyces TaxID=2593676 RepID=UPI000DBA7F77|nr:MULTISPECIES: zf-HC2 domain-containing protein [unclassified Streptomyces]MYT71275.1 RNA polymerase subunit sigma [Streptomyces sp. SID8367]RAJ72542.1 putative zinc finger protein [Streptomyces sp. PsTaAH-137]
MTTGYGGHGGYGDQGPGDVHETVGAYALGVLDDAEATAFEVHLAGCERCARQLDEFAGMGPVLAALADVPPGRATPVVGESLAARPSPRLAETLVGEVARRRGRKRRHGLYLVAAAAALIIGGPLTVLAATGGDDGGGTVTAHAAGPAEDAFQHISDKVEATDATTNVSATVGMEKKAWGTHTVLELKNVKGPLTCSLVAVGKNGERETVTTWAVPKWGYGIAGSAHESARYPLYVHGGAAFTRDQIDHFEVETLDGKRLVEVNA